MFRTTFFLLLTFLLALFGFVLSVFTLYKTSAVEPEVVVSLPERALEVVASPSAQPEVTVTASPSPVVKKGVPFQQPSVSPTP